MLTCGWVHPHVPGPSPTGVHGCAHSRREHPGYPPPAPHHQGRGAPPRDTGKQDSGGDAQTSLGTGRVHPNLAAHPRLLPRENSGPTAPARGCPEDHRAWPGDRGAPGVLPATPLSQAPREGRTSSRTALLRAGTRPPRLPLWVSTPQHSLPTAAGPILSHGPRRGNATFVQRMAQGGATSPGSPGPTPSSVAPSPDPLPTHTAPAHLHTLCPRAGLLGEAPCPQQPH